MIFIIIIILIIIIKVRDSRPAPWERGAKEWGPWTGLLHHHDHHHHHPSSSSSLSSSTSSPLCWRHHYNLKHLNKKLKQYLQYTPNRAFNVASTFFFDLLVAPPPQLGKPNIFPQSSRGITGQFTWHNGAINSVQSAINIGPNWHLKDLELRNCTLRYFYIGKLEKEPHSSSTVLGFKSIIPHFIFIGYMIGLQQFWILTLFNSITDQFHNCKGTKKDPNLKLLGVKDPTTTPSNGHSGQWTCIWWTWWTWWTWISIWPSLHMSLHPCLPYTTHRPF